METAKTEISRNEPLKNGDVVEFHYKYPFWYGEGTWGSYWQIKLVEKRFTDKGYNVLSIKQTQTHIIARVLIAEEEPEEIDGVPVQKAGVMITAGIIAATVIIGGAFLWLSLDRVYKITQSPAGATASISLAVIAAGILLLIFVKRS